MRLNVLRSTLWAAACMALLLGTGVQAAPYAVLGGGPVGDAVASIGDTVGGVTDTVSDTVDDAADTAGDAASDAVDDATDTVDTVADAAEDTTGLNLPVSGGDIDDAVDGVLGSGSSGGASTSNGEEEAAVEAQEGQETPGDGALGERGGGSGLEGEESLGGSAMPAWVLPVAIVGGVLAVGGATTGAILYRRTH